MTRTVRLESGHCGFVRAERLCAVSSILRCYKHGNSVVNGQHKQREHHCGHEKCLGSGPATSDLENLNPQEADSHSSHTRNRAAKEKEDEKRHENIVNRENFGGLEENPVQWLEDNVSASLLADGVLGLVNSRDEHGYPDENRDYQEQKATKHLDWPEQRAKLEPEAVHGASAFALSLSSKALPSYKCLFLADESIQLAAVLSRHFIMTSGIAHFNLALSLAVHFQLGCGCL
ncbi:unnamed protein product [Clonostachys solani]|uniref:Uncharacterized protein n=1 Tax=Clonostachys solani TaxID=160281 RepID=A0A9P0EFF8_9HYPO|nr:unnamed protein product [Clonostachys solani]